MTMASKKASKKTAKPTSTKSVATDKADVRCDYLWNEKSYKDRVECLSMKAAFKKTGELFGHGELDLASIKCTTKKSKLKGKPLQQVRIKLNRPFRIPRFLTDLPIPPQLSPWATRAFFGTANCWQLA